MKFFVKDFEHGMDAIKGIREQDKIIRPSQEINVTAVLGGVPVAEHGWETKQVPPDFGARHGHIQDPLP